MYKGDEEKYEQRTRESYEEKRKWYRPARVWFWIRSKKVEFSFFLTLSPDLPLKPSSRRCSLCWPTDSMEYRTLQQLRCSRPELSTNPRWCWVCERRSEWYLWTLIERLPEVCCRFRDWEEEEEKMKSVVRITVPRTHLDGVDLRLKLTRWLWWGRKERRTSRREDVKVKN